MRRELSDMSIVISVEAATPEKIGGRMRSFNHLFSVAITVKKYGCLDRTIV